MALGAMLQYDCEIDIVPCGLTYYKVNKTQGLDINILNRDIILEAKLYWNSDSLYQCQKI